MIGISSLCYIQGLKVIGRLLLGKRHFEGFYHIRALRPYWLCDPDTPNKSFSSRTIDAPPVFWLQLIKRY